MREYINGSILLLYQVILKEDDAMNKHTILYIVVGVIIGLIVMYVAYMQTFNNKLSINESAEINQDSQIKLTEKNCLADDCLLVENVDFPVGDLPNDVLVALGRALDDEYKALATYEAVVSKFGASRPFSMIKGAEEQHIASLKAIYDKYGLEIPSNM